LVHFEDPAPAPTVTSQRWFGRELFDGVDEAVDGSVSPSLKKAPMIVLDSDNEVDESDEGDESDEEGGRWLHERGGEGDEDDSFRKKKKQKTSSSLSSSSINSETKQQTIAEEMATKIKRRLQEKKLNEKEKKEKMSKSDHEENGVGEEKKEKKLNEEELAKQQLLKAQKKEKKKKGKKKGEEEMDTVDNMQFEEVPQEEYEDDDEAQAELLAMGTMMARKKNKTKIINDGYNRYAYNDPNLPDWFAEEEDRHNKKSLPVTKDMVDAFKAQLAEINSRPIKKIAEAKARKKMKTVKRWEKTKEQANQIVNTASLSQSDKLRNIEKLYKKKDKRTIKRDKKYVVSRKGSTQQAKKTSGRGKITYVDSRLKKDKFAEKRNNKKGEKRKR